MNGFDKLMVLLSVLLIVLVFIQFLELWGIALSVLFLLLTVIITRIEMKKRFIGAKEKRKRMISIIFERLDKFDDGIEKLRNEINTLVRIESSIEEKMGINNAFKIDMEKDFREIARKLFEAENNINQLKKTVGAGLGSFDERIKNLEKREETEPF